jgi:hypothetical protein
MPMAPRMWPSCEPLVTLGSSVGADRDGRRQLSAKCATEGHGELRMASGCKPPLGTTCKSRKASRTYPVLAGLKSLDRLYCVPGRAGGSSGGTSALLLSRERRSAAPVVTIALCMARGACGAPPSAGWESARFTRESRRFEPAAPMHQKASCTRSGGPPIRRPRLRIARPRPK